MSSVLPDELTSLARADVAVPAALAATTGSVGESAYAGWGGCISRGGEERAVHADVSATVSTSATAVNARSERRVKNRTETRKSPENSYFASKDPVSGQ